MSSRRFAPVRFWPRKVNFTVWPWAWAWLWPSSLNLCSVLRLFVRALLHSPTSFAASWLCLGPWLCVRCWLYLGPWRCLAGSWLYLGPGSWLCFAPFRAPILLHLPAIEFNSSWSRLKLSSALNHNDKKPRCPNFQRFSGSKCGPERVSHRLSNLLRVYSTGSSDIGIHRALTADGGDVREGGRGGGDLD